eukprot:3856861-Prymnesium_polylepis.1
MPPLLSNKPSALTTPPLTGPCPLRRDVFTAAAEARLRRDAAARRRRTTPRAAAPPPPVHPACATRARDVRTAVVQP